MKFCVSAKGGDEKKELIRGKSYGVRAAVSHISRKTSEMPRISCTLRQRRPRVRLSLRKGA
jgi:hypothetical protein